MSFEIEHRRLIILRYLEGAPDFTANGSMLTDVLREYGNPATYDQVTAALAWLKEQELIKLTDHDEVVIATITARGADVAKGSAVHPGVKRPSPRR